MNIQLAKPDITEDEVMAVAEVMRSGILSIGPKILEFEKRIAEYIGVKHAVAVNSGTSALNLIVKILGIGKDDEVITTPFSFVASANCFIMEGAMPAFVDIDPETLNMDIDRIEENITDRTKAILAVDAFGQPINMIRLREIAKKYGLLLIEDACEALGSSYAGHMAGKLGDASAFAFYPNKQITTGEGGIITTDNDYIAEMARSLRSQGRAVTGFWLEHERLGYNYRMNEMQAALGCVQMDRLDQIISRRRKVAGMYDEILGDIEGLTIPCIHPDVTAMSYFVYVVKLDSLINRNKLMNYLIKNGIGCRPYFTPIHIQPYMAEMFEYREEDYPFTADAGRRCLALPFHNKLTYDEIQYVAVRLKEGIGLFSNNSLS